MINARQAGALESGLTGYTVVCDGRTRNALLRRELITSDGYLTEAGRDAFKDWTERPPTELTFRSIKS